MSMIQYCWTHNACGLSLANGLNIFISMSFCILIIEIPEERVLLYPYTQIWTFVLHSRSHSVNAEDHMCNKD